MKDYRNKLSEEQKWVIRRDHKHGVRQCELAKQYNVSESTISLVVRPEAYLLKRQYNHDRYHSKVKRREDK